MDVQISRAALERAVKEAGSKSALARIAGVAQPTVSYWIDRGMVPGDYVPAIESATGVPRHELRPDLWQAPETAA